MATQEQGDVRHVQLENVSKQFGAVEVIRDLSLTVSAGEFCALLGPSGCGKSTLLRMIAGLETVTSGSIVISGRDVTQVPPAKRRISMVFQSYALYPHMTVRQNIAFSLDIAGVPKPEMAAKTEKVARLLQLEDYLDRKPSQLSGGQRQRVAIGRALVRDPEVFLFDEPLSNLDAKLRVQMRLELAKLHQDLRSTMIYVTHDQVEAMTLADRIVVLDSGRIAQVGSPLDLYRRPENKFVAAFIGSPAMNFLPVQPMDGADGNVTISLGGAMPLTVALRNGARASEGDAFELGIRPEHAGVTEAADPAALMTGRITMLERLGNATMLYIETERGMMVVEEDSESPARIGDAVGIKMDPERAHLFAADGTAV
ncbi:MAG TPA: ABC transporter ATP-binding protein [Devosiaceae bacterium]|jgi:multiple sugar transport system ATP-binding protein|nr:ABC transporter ATP-binding protein [Devosiaceae bacterium]